MKISQAVAKTLRDESSAASRSGGAEAKLGFVEAEAMTDAVTPSGVVVTFLKILTLVIGKPGKERFEVWRKSR